MTMLILLFYDNVDNVIRMMLIMQWRHFEFGQCLHAYNTVHKFEFVPSLCQVTLCTGQRPHNEDHIMLSVTMRCMMNEENTQLPISSNVSIFKVATCKKFILLLWQCKTGVCYIAAAAVELNSRFSSKVTSFTHISAFIQNTLCGVFILREICKKNYF